MDRDVQSLSGNDREDYRNVAQPCASKYEPGCLSKYFRVITQSSDRRQDSKHSPTTRKDGLADKSPALKQNNPNACNLPSYGSGLPRPSQLRRQIFCCLRSRGRMLGNCRSNRNHLQLSRCNIQYPPIAFSSFTTRQARHLTPFSTGKKNPDQAVTGSG
jgi:hypothetical protein